MESSSPFILVPVTSLQHTGSVGAGGQAIQLEMGADGKLMVQQTMAMPQVGGIPLAPGIEITPPAFAGVPAPPPPPGMGKVALPTAWLSYWSTGSVGASIFYVDPSNAQAMPLATCLGKFLC